MSCITQTLEAVDCTKLGVMVLTASVTASVLNSSRVGKSRSRERLEEIHHMHRASNKIVLWNM